MKKRIESRALDEVREWKDACAREVADLELAAAVHKRLNDSEETARELGFGPPEPDVQKVAEASGAYRTRGSKSR